MMKRKPKRPDAAGADADRKRRRDDSEAAEKWRLEQAQRLIAEALGKGSDK